MQPRLAGKTAFILGAGLVGSGWGNGRAAAVLFARVERWTSIWNVYRHRMPPAAAARIADELAVGGLRVQATQRLEPIVDGDALEVEFASPEGLIERVRAAAVIDCTGPQLDPARSEQSLLRGLVDNGIARRHHTGPRLPHRRSAASRARPLRDRQSAHRSVVRDSSRARAA